MKDFSYMRSCGRFPYDWLRTGTCGHSGSARIKFTRLEPKRIDLKALAKASWNRDEVAAAPQYFPGHIEMEMSMDKGRQEKQVHTWQGATEFWRENGHLSESVSGDAHGYTSGRFRETHFMSDGRVVELWENNSGFLGNLQWCIEWETYGAWMAHDHFPRNIKHEVGL